VLAKSTNDEEKDSNDLIHTENQIDRDLDPHGNLTYTTVVSVDMRILTPRIYRYAWQVLEHECSQT